MDHQPVDPQSTSNPNDITDPIVASQIELLIQQYVIPFHILSSLGIRVNSRNCV